jgi:4-amino-4-deoxy-L-arabinose transferase-like glycosyltransferase
MSKILCSLGLGLYLLLFAVLNLYLLDQQPTVNVDEPWYSDAVLSFARTGHFTPTMFRGMHYNLEGKYRWSLRELLLAAVFKIFGFGVYQARFLPFLSGLIALSLIFLLGKQLYNSQVGILAAILFAFSPIYEMARFARPDMMMTAFTLAALYLCCLGLQHDSPILYCSSGLISLLSADVHLNGVMVLATIGLLYLTRSKTSLMKSRAVGFYLLGVMVGVVYWLLAYGPMLKELNVEGFVVPTNSWARTLWKLKTYGDWFYGGSFQYVSFHSLLMLVSLVRMGIRRKAADKFLLTSIAAFVPFYLFVFWQPQGNYLVYLFPLLYLAVSTFIYDSIWSITRSTSTTTSLSKGGLVGVGMLIILLGFAMGKATAGIKEALRHRSAGGYYEYIEKLKVYIPANAVVMGQPTWFYGFYNQPYYADRYFAWIARSRYDQVRERLGRSFKEAIAQVGVEYLIIDSELYDLMVKRKNGLHILPGDEVIAFLQEKCVLAGEVEDEFYGFTRVYKVKTDIQ